MARWSLALSVLFLAGCAGAGAPHSRIIVAGQEFETEARVITWKDAGGFDGYRETCWFQPERILPEKPVEGCDVPKRYGARRTTGLAPELATRVEAEGYDLDAARERIDQFVIHYDVCLHSEQCFKVLHDLRGLSVHFLLDLDGTVYQTLDLVERARQATIANDRSIGVEIAQMGAYADRKTLDRWYEPDGANGVRLKPSLIAGRSAHYPPGFVARPARAEPIRGTVNGNDLHQYDFTEAQYDALAKLTRTLTEALPRIRLRVPRGEDGRVLDRPLTPSEFASYQGLLGHSHVQQNKSDPGPAFDWDRVLRDAAPRP